MLFNGRQPPTGPRSFEANNRRGGRSTRGRGAFEAGRGGRGGLGGGRAGYGNAHPAAGRTRRGSAHPGAGRTGSGIAPQSNRGSTRRVLDEGEVMMQRPTVDNPDGFLEQQQRQHQYDAAMKSMRAENAALKKRIEELEQATNTPVPPVAIAEADDLADDLERRIEDMHDAERVEDFERRIEDNADAERVEDWERRIAENQAREAEEDRIWGNF